MLLDDKSSVFGHKLDSSVIWCTCQTEQFSEFLGHVFSVCSPEYPTWRLERCLSVIKYQSTYVLMHVQSCPTAADVDLVSSRLIDLGLALENVLNAQQEGAPSKTTDTNCAAMKTTPFWIFSFIFWQWLEHSPWKHVANVLAMSNCTFSSSSAWDVREYRNRFNSQTAPILFTAAVDSVYARHLDPHRSRNSAVSDPLSWLDIPENFPSVFWDSMCRQSSNSRRTRARGSSNIPKQVVDVGPLHARPRQTSCICRSKLH